MTAEQVDPTARASRAGGLRVGVSVIEVRPSSFDMAVRLRPAGQDQGEPANGRCAAVIERRATGERIVIPREVRDEFIAIQLAVRALCRPRAASRCALIDAPGRHSDTHGVARLRAVSSGAFAMNRHVDVLNGRWSASPVEAVLAAVARRRADEQEGLARALDLDAVEVGRRADAIARFERPHDPHRPTVGAPAHDR